MPDNVEGYDFNTGADFNVELKCPECKGDILAEVLDMCKELDKGPMSPTLDSWSCNYCTTQNHKDLPICEMCLQPRLNCFHRSGYNLLKYRGLL